MPLSPQEIQAARAQYGIKTDATILDTSPSAQKPAEITGDALTSFLTDGKVKAPKAVDPNAPTDNIFTRGFKAIKEAVPTLINDFSKRGKDITDYTAKTGNDYNIQVQPHDVVRAFKGEFNGNPAVTQLLAPVKNALNFVGQTGGAVGDILGEGIKAGYKTFTPESVQQTLATGVHNLMQTSVGQEGLAKLGEGIDAYNAWKATNPDGAKAVENVVNVATLFGASAAEKTAKPIIEKAIDTTVPIIKDVAGKSAEVITDATKLAQEKVGGILDNRKVASDAKKKQSIDTLAGTIAQGTAADVAKVKSSIPMLDISKVKTYKDLTTAFNDKIAEVSGGLDGALGTNATARKLADLTVTSKVGEKEIAHNFVEDAISQLKTMYEKTNDVVGAEKIAQLEAKAGAEGLTVKEINDLAKLHGKEINAFNANGEAASGLTKQAAENTRTGLKTTARTIFNNPVYEAADAQLTNLIRSRDLVEGVAKKVTQLQQRVTQRGLGERAGRLVFQIIDKVTGGGMKGFIQSFVPRGEGLKIMNALDLEKNLNKNLNKLQNALDGKTEADVMKKLEGMINESFPRDTSLKGADAAVQEASISKYVKTPIAMAKEYMKTNGKVVNTDEARKLFKDVGYAGHNAAAVQEASSALAKDVWKRLLKKSKATDALIFAGGSGTGKTSAVKNLLAKEVQDAGAILDGNLSTTKSALARIKETIDAGKTPHIVYVYRAPADAWINGVIKRMRENVSEGGRIVPLSVFMENHKGSHDVVKSLLENGKIKVSMVDNSLGQGKHALLTPEKFNKITYTKATKNKLLAETKKLLDNGSITQQQYEALIK